MPRGRGYGRRRRMTAHSTALVPMRRRKSALGRAFRGGSYAGAAAGRMSQLEAAYHIGSFMLDNYKKAGSRLKLGQAKVKRLKQTAAKQRAAAKRVMKGKGKSNMNRHTEQKSNSKKPNTGSGFDTARNGVIVTHPNSRIPKWKKERKWKYKHSVYQTVLISKTSRLPNSQNQLEGCRYPIKLPEAKADRIQTIIFTPFCSNFTGTHTTFFRNVKADATDIEHNTTYPLDVVQNKASMVQFLSTGGMIEGNAAPAKPQHETGYTGTDPAAALSGPSYSAANARGAANLKVVKSHIDQLVKSIKVDLVFTSSRAYDIECSVSVIRMIKPDTPWSLTTNDKREICNSLDNRGMEWTRWKTEWLHKFILPGLKAGKKPPQVSIQKILKTNFLQTNSFKENTTGDDYTEIYGASGGELGRNLHHAHDEISDGAMSGNFLILIKHRRKCVPQTFQYHQAIEVDSDSTSNRFASAYVSMPAVSEESMDIPPVTGITGADSDGADFETGEPFSTDQGNEKLSSCYVVGKLVYEFGFRKEVESNPSLISNATSNVHYKKPLSLNIDITNTADDTNGFYTKSASHTNLPTDTHE